MASSVAAVEICWGTSKKTNRRCQNKAKGTEPGYLPTCHQHRDQLLRPGSCQHLVDVKTGARCKRRFHYDPPPPYFELCPKHMNTPQGPCHLLRLPVELRMEIYQYFLQPGAVVSNRPNGISSEKLQAYLPLLFVNKQIGSEAQDHLYACTTFHVEVGQQGAIIRNRYLYRPRGAEDRCDDDPDREVGKALDIRQQLNFSRIKNINLEVIVVNSSGLEGWSEEVEMYDLRDSISAILPYLARAQSLHKLTVRVVCSRFDRWPPAKALVNFKLITQPLGASLRNITRPILEPPYKGDPYFACWGTPTRSCSRTSSSVSSASSSLATTTAATATPPLPAPWTCDLTGTLVPATTHPVAHAEFLAYKQAFETLAASSEPIPPKPPVARMFSAFKRVYLECASLLLNNSNASSKTTLKNKNNIGSAALPSGAANYLHRARVAREHADLDAFVAARNSFVQRWNAYLEQRYRELARVNGLVVEMYGADDATVVGASGATGAGDWDPRLAFLGGGGGGGHQQQQQQSQLASPPAESVGAVGLRSPSMGMIGNGPWVGSWNWNGCVGDGAGGGGGGDEDDGAAGDCDAAMALGMVGGGGEVDAAAAVPAQGSLFACGFG